MRGISCALSRANASALIPTLTASAQTNGAATPPRRIFSLRLKLSGKLRVVLCSRHFINSQSVRAVLAEKVVQADSVQEFCFDFPKGADGMLFF